MATAAQINASRANTKNSTGPASESGNALRHGLTSKHLFVSPGAEAEFEAFDEHLSEALSPEGPRQILVYNHVLSAAWRLLRCDRAEAGLAARSAEAGLDPLLDPACHGTLAVIETARTLASRQFKNSIAELRRIQTEDEYRAAAMPEEDGCVSTFLGVGDWQSIRTRLKKETLMDDKIAANAALPWNFNRRYTPAPEEEEIYKTNPIASDDSARHEPENGKTNPIPAEFAEMQRVRRKNGKLVTGR
jgi:hypothetical protein